MWWSTRNYGGKYKAIKKGEQKNIMTYLELLDKATKLLDDNKITIGEWEKMIEPLRNQVIPDFLYWIPVTERLPKEHGDYLVTATGKSQGKKYIRVELGQWLGDAFWIGWYEPNKKILAWMPLPQPWKESR